jgi:hypothetical protein
VRQVTLDGLLKSERGIDLIKIDVEGAEFLVLRGAQKTLDRVRYVMVELHDLRRKSELEKALSDHSFSYRWVDLHHILGIHGDARNHHRKGNDKSRSKTRVALAQ